jgi:hypothetical protein
MFQGHLKFIVKTFHCILYNNLHIIFSMSWDTAVSFVTAYGLDDKVLILTGGNFVFATPYSDWLWGSLSLLSNGCWQVFPWE